MWQSSSRDSETMPVSLGTSSLLQSGQEHLLPGAAAED